MNLPPPIYFIEVSESSLLEIKFTEAMTMPDDLKLDRRRELEEDERSEIAKKYLEISF